jgi:hypothetical protein
MNDIAYYAFQSINVASCLIYSNYSSLTALQTAAMLASTSLIATFFSIIAAGISRDTTPTNRF